MSENAKEWVSTFAGCLVFFIEAYVLVFLLG
jgi:hypothetical protein